MLFIVNCLLSVLDFKFKHH